MSRRSKAIYQRGEYWLGWDIGVSGAPRKYLTIFWYDREQQRVRRTSTRTAEIDRAIALLDARYLSDGNQSGFCPTCGRPSADAESYLITEAIADYRIEIGDARPSASSISARLNHVVDYLEQTDCLGTTCRDAATEKFAQGLRSWSRRQPVVWRNKRGEVTASKLRTPAATEESINQLRAVLNHAIANDRSDAKPRFKSLSRKQVSKPVMVRCDMSVLAAMLQYAAANERRTCLHAFLIGSICTIARPDAVLDINTAPGRKQWSPRETFLDLNPEGRVQTKKYRPILPLNPILNIWLDHTHRSSGGGGGWLVSHRGLPVKSVKGAWRSMLDELGLPRDRDWMPYVLRRSLAHELRNRQVDPWDLAGYMGHRVVGTTEIYTGGALFSTVSKNLSEILEEMDLMAPGALHPKATPFRVSNAGKSQIKT